MTMGIQFIIQGKDKSLVDISIGVKNETMALST